MLEAKNVALLVGGSIAAYKSAELLREFVKNGARVRPVMSEAARRFITPLTLEALSGEAVIVDMFEDSDRGKISHIERGDSADVVVAAPATANLIAKAASGIADDLSSCILLSTKAPVVIAPAMNSNMWEHPATQANVALLKERGLMFVGPEVGDLACGYTGRGRLASLDHIVQMVQKALSWQDLEGCRVVVSAGPTREYFDPIRFVSNRSSGRMGYALAHVAFARGADVALVSGPSELGAPYGVDCHRVERAAEMREKLLELLMKKPDAEAPHPRRQYVFMVAAVSDLRPSGFSDSKLKWDKKKKCNLEMEPTEDILGEIGKRRSEIESYSGTELKVIGFAAETGEEEELLRWGRSKLEAKKADLIVANFAHESFEKNTNRVWLLSRNGREEEVATADKLRVAGRIISAALRC